MKLTNTKSLKRKSGMTLLELTVVILVLLSLISILFIGARAWKKGSDKAGCILNLRNVQLAVRSQANLNNLAIDDALLNGALIGAGLYMESAPTCPGDHTAYTFGTTVPAVGTLYATCGNGDATIKATHVPTSHTDW